MDTAIKKIIFFTYGIVGGGAERVTTLICNALSELEYDVYIATNEVTPVYELSPKVQLLYYGITGKKLKYRTQLLKGMRSILKEHRPDYAVGVMNFYSTYLRLASIGIPSVKLIAWDHSAFTRPKSVDFSLVARFEKLCVYPFFDKVFVLTEVDRRAAWYKRNIVVMPNPITFQAPMGFPEKQNVIIGVGNIGTWDYKGFDLLVKSWALLSNNHKNWKLRIYGGGDHSYINELITRLGLESSVELVSFVSDIKTAYLNASIFVLSSRSEGFSMVLLEAMSQGCACAACDNMGRTKEIIEDQITGLIYQTENIGEMANSIETLINNKEFRNKLGTNAIQKSQDFSMNVIIKKWISVLGEV